MKKLFFNYSEEAEDVKMMRNLCLHFAVLKDQVDLWHKGRILPGDNVDETLSLNLSNADAVLHLLSISYAAENDCMELLGEGIEKDKNNIPVLLSSFDWESVDEIKLLEEKLLPQDHQPVDLHPNYNEVYTEIVQTVKKDVLGIETKAGSNGRMFYYVLSGLILVIGVLATIWTKDSIDNWGITAGLFSLFIIAAFFIMRKIIFPTSISTSKL